MGGATATEGTGPDPADNGLEDAGVPEHPSLQISLLDWYADHDSDESSGHPEGTLLSMMQRHEGRNVGNLGLMTAEIVDAARGDEVVAVFRADCGAWGWLTLDRLTKVEEDQPLQDPLAGLVDASPLSSLHGCGEIAVLGGRNRLHNHMSDEDTGIVASGGMHDR